MTNDTLALIDLGSICGYAGAMASKDSKDRYQKFVDAGKAVSKLTTDRFEEVAKDLIHLSEVQRVQAQELLEDILNRSKKSTEFVVDTVRREVDKQLKGVKFASRDDLATLADRVNQMKSDIASLGALREDLRRDVIKLTEALAGLVARKDQSTVAPPTPKSDAAPPAAEADTASKAAPKTSPSKPAATRRPAPRRAPSKKADGGPGDGGSN